MTYTNNELFPKLKKPAKPNNHIDSVIMGHGNIVESSAQNVNVNGDANYVGVETGNINILNSSGCIVSSGVIGCTLINCSGISIYEDNLVYINNLLFSSATTSSSGYRKTVTQYTVMVEGDGTIDLQYTTSGGVCYLPSPVGHFKKFVIKNNNTTSNPHDVWCVGFSIDNGALVSGAGQITLGYLDSVTVQSNGADNYLII